MKCSIYLLQSAFRKKINRNTESGGAQTGRNQTIQEMNEEGGYTITELVRVAKITRQAYYKWLTPEPTAKELQDQHLLALIIESEKEHQHCLGSGKMTRLINKCGHLSFPVNHKRVRRIMREHDIRADYRCPKCQRQQTKQAYATANVLKRQFKQNEINHVWVTDTTEVSYGKQNYKVRLHGVLDLCGQYLISYLVTPTETAEGAIAVFERAKQEVGMIAPLVHSDRGAAYISEAFNRYLMNNDVQHSYSASGTPADNAVIEHWWADFKSIWLNHQPPAQTLEELLKQIAEGVNYFNTKYISGKRNDLTAAEYRNRKAI